MNSVSRRLALAAALVVIIAGGAVAAVSSSGGNGSAVGDPAPRSAHGSVASRFAALRAEAGVSALRSGGGSAA